jgi:hypothetical protein
MLEVGLMLARHCDLYGMYCVNIVDTHKFCCAINLIHLRHILVSE